MRIVANDANQGHCGNYLQEIVRGNSREGRFGVPPEKHTASGITSNDWKYTVFFVMSMASLGGLLAWLAGTGPGIRIMSESAKIVARM